MWWWWGGGGIHASKQASKVMLIFLHFHKDAPDSRSIQSASLHVRGPIRCSESPQPPVCLCEMVSVWNFGRGQKLAGIFMTQPHHLAQASPNQTGTLRNKGKISWRRCLSSEWPQLPHGMPTCGSWEERLSVFSASRSLTSCSVRIHIFRVGFLSFALSPPAILTNSCQEAGSP